MTESRWLLPSCAHPSRIIPGRWLFDAVAMPHRVRYIQAYTQRCYLRRVYELRAALYDMVSSGVFEMSYADVKDGDRKRPAVDDRREQTTSSSRWRLPRPFLVGADRVAPRHHVRRPHSHYHLMSPGDYKLHFQAAYALARDAYDGFFELSPDADQTEASCAREPSVRAPSPPDNAREHFSEFATESASTIENAERADGGGNRREAKTERGASDGDDSGDNKMLRTVGCDGASGPDAVAPGMYPKQFRLSISSPCCMGHVCAPTNAVSSGGDDDIINTGQQSTVASCAVQLHHPLRLSVLNETPGRYVGDESGSRTFLRDDPDKSSSMGPLVTTRRDLPVLACITMPTINSFLDPAASIVEPLVIPTRAVIDDYDRHVARLFQTRSGLAEHPCRNHLTRLVNDRTSQYDVRRNVRQRLPLSGLLIDVSVGMCVRLLAAHRHARQRDRRRARAGQAPDRLLFWCLYCPAINLVRFGCTRVDAVRDIRSPPPSPATLAAVLPLDASDDEAEPTKSSARRDAANVMYTFRDAAPRVVDVPALVPIPQLNGHSILR
jgi:hypothetical protein